MSDYNEYAPFICTDPGKVNEYREDMAVLHKNGGQAASDIQSVLVSEVSG